MCSEKGFRLEETARQPKMRDLDRETLTDLRQGAVRIQELEPQLMVQRAMRLKRRKVSVSGVNSSE